MIASRPCALNYIADHIFWVLAETHALQAIDLLLANTGVSFAGKLNQFLQMLLTCSLGGAQRAQHDAAPLHFAS